MTRWQFDLGYFLQWVAVCHKPERCYTMDLPTLLTRNMSMVDDYKRSKKINWCFTVITFWICCDGFLNRLSQAA